MHKRCLRCMLNRHSVMKETRLDIPFRFQRLECNSKSSVTVSKVKCNSSRTLSVPVTTVQVFTVTCSCTPCLKCRFLVATSQTCKLFLLELAVVIVIVVSQNSTPPIFMDGHLLEINSSGCQNTFNGLSGGGWEVSHTCVSQFI